MNDFVHVFCEWRSQSLKTIILDSFSTVHHWNCQTFFQRVRKNIISWFLPTRTKTQTIHSLTVSYIQAKMNTFRSIYIRYLYSLSTKSSICVRRLISWSSGNRMISWVYKGAIFYRLSFHYVFLTNEGPLNLNLATNILFKNHSRDLDKYHFNMSRKSAFDHL